jgi:hypothetical protein
MACSKGVCQETAMAVVGLAINLRVDGRYQEANEYAEIGIKLIDKFPHELGSTHAQVRSTAVIAVFSASRPFSNTLDALLESHHVSLRTGDTEKAALAIVGYASGYMCVGLPLGPLESDLQAFGREARQFGMPYTIQVLFLVFRQVIKNLQEPGADPTVLKGEIMDCDEELKKVEGHGATMTRRDINSCELMLACIYNDFDRAEKLVDALESYLTGDSFISRAYHRTLFMGLASIVLGRTSGKRKYRALGKKVIKNFTSDLKKGSVNAHPIVLMLEAEESPSKERYDKAISGCARLGLVHYEAYMCERAGLYFIEIKDESWAEFYLGQAFVLYEDWGATGKAGKLREEHRGILRSSSFHANANTALKGRARYSSEHADSMREVSFSELSSGSGKRSSGATNDTRSSTSSGTDGNDSFLGGSTTLLGWS